MAKLVYVKHDINDNTNTFIADNFVRTEMCKENCLNTSKMVEEKADDINRAIHSQNELFLNRFTALEERIKKQEDQINEHVEDALFETKMDMHKEFSYLQRKNVDLAVKVSEFGFDTDNKFKILLYGLVVLWILNILVILIITLLEVSAMFNRSIEQNTDSSYIYEIIEEEENDYYARV